MYDDNDAYWEMRRDIRKDDQILYDPRYTPAGECPDNYRNREANND